MFCVKQFAVLPAGLPGMPNTYLLRILSSMSRRKRGKLQVRHAKYNEASAVSVQRRHKSISSTVYLNMVVEI